MAAPTFGNTVSERLRVPAPKGAAVRVPRYTLDEVATTAEYFTALDYITGELMDD